MIIEEFDPKLIRWTSLKLFGLLLSSNKLISGGVKVFFRLFSQDLESLNINSNFKINAFLYIN